MTTFTRVAKAASLVVLAVVIVAAYSSWYRPMGIDEVLHFALGPLTPSEALETIHATTGPNVNHGQTGFLMFVNYLLLQPFGASVLALRLPSLIATFILFASAVYFLRSMSLGWLWQVLLLLAFAAQSDLMFFAGEGRPYMLFVSTSVATLAYFQVPFDRRRRWLFLLLGVYAIIIGAANHPDYPVMYVGLLAVSLLTEFLPERRFPTLREITKRADIPLASIGLVVYVSLGLLTWMRGTPAFDFDPWGPVGDPVTAGKVLIASHAEMLGSLPEVKLFVLALIVMTALLFYRPGSVDRLVPPLALITFGVGTSVIFSGASFLRDYWILPRQWVAGVALCSIGFVWLLARLFELARLHESFFIAFVVLASGTYVALLATAQIVAAGDRSKDSG